jgi:hypothetical protein
MFRLDDPDPWSMGEQWGGPVAFTVWALQSDGLRVPPFDAHPDGDGRLRAAGLDAEGWLGWVGELVARDSAAQTALHARARPGPEQIARMQAAGGDREAMMREVQRWSRESRASRSMREGARLSRQAGDVVGAWAGAKAVRPLLEELHKAWQREHRAPSAPRWHTPDRDDASVQAGHALYGELRASANRPNRSTFTARSTRPRWCSRCARTACSSACRPTPPTTATPT